MKILADAALEGGGSPFKENNADTVEQMEEAPEAMEESVGGEKPSPKETLRGFGLGRR